MNIVANLRLPLTLAVVSVTSLVAALFLDSPTRGEMIAVLMAVAVLSCMAGNLLTPPRTVR